MPPRPLRASSIGSLVLAMFIGSDATAWAQPLRLTVDHLRALTSSTNDTAGDAFTGTPAALNAVLDAMAADSSLVGPMQLFLASSTALRLVRVEDAGFFFYAAQVRAAFDFERFDVSARADGNNAATYLGFLRETIGEQVNPAIMREPAKFAAVVTRLERWEVVPSPTRITRSSTRPPSSCRARAGPRPPPRSRRSSSRRSPGARGRC
jgi:hypothetical protein